MGGGLPFNRDSGRNIIARLDGSIETITNADVVKRLDSRGHRLFPGRIEGSDLGISEKALIALVRAPDGDFRPWTEIATWAESIASQLQEPPTT